MANLLAVCRFVAGSSGTADFDDGTAMIGFENLSDAGAVNGALYPYRAESIDKSEWEIGYGTYDSSGGTLSRTTIIASSTGSKVNFTNAPLVMITPLVDDFSVWAMQPLGVPIPVYTSLWGTLFDALPPIDSPSFKYILLTAGEDGAGEYNEGVLDGESVSGSAPLVLATANINYAGSPLDNATVRLINTERRFLRAGSVGTVENDQMQTITGTIQLAGTSSGSASGALDFVASAPNLRQTNGTNSGINITFNSANSTGARAGTETRSKNVGVNYVMRIA